MRVLTGEPVTDPRELAGIIAEIVRENRRWDQRTWFGDEWFHNTIEVSVQRARASLSKGCTATGCVAGWAVILDAPAGSLIDIHDNVILPDGEEADAHSYGKGALNLTSRQADWLFDGTRTQDEVLYALDAIAAGRHWDPPAEDRLAYRWAAFLGDPPAEDRLAYRWAAFLGY